MFNITYTEGYFNGLLFYANIVSLNDFIFVPYHSLPILSFTIISWMNLDLGFGFCVYNGMDAYAKLWLSFCFPVYIFLIVGIIVFVCRKSDRIARIFSGNIIPVLATLFQLSYTSLIQSVVTALSFTQIQYPSCADDSSSVNKLVWLADPDLEYFRGKHIPLALVSLVFGLLILAYTLVLLFIHPLQRCSHLRCFTWVAKLKPLIDAYTAPHIIKDNCRYWEGLLLFFRLILSVMFMANIKNRINLNLIAICAISLIILTMTWGAGGIYKKTHLNVLNSFSVLNLTALSIAMNNIIRSQNTRTRVLHKKVFTNISFGIAFVIFLAILTKCVYRRMVKWYLKCRKRKYQAVPLDVSDTTPSLRTLPYSHAE